MAGLPACSFRASAWCRKKRRPRTAACRPHPDSFVLVDPLDGTRELVAGRDEFTVNVAIVSSGRPRLGIVSAPAQGIIWRGIEGMRRRAAPPCRRSTGKRRAGARRHPHPALPPRRLCCGGQPLPSRRRHRRFLARLPTPQRLASGSAVKFCQSRKAPPTSIRDSRPPANGTWPPAMPSLQPRAELLTPEGAP